jgi:hypothetical protein
MCQNNKTMKFFISKNKKLPRDAQKGLLPREEFMTKGKERFLAAFDASELARNARAASAQARPAYVTMFFKAGVGVMAMLAVGVGLSAYADTANVAVTNPLYPLKRISENVRLALAPTAEKPQLEATFAVRRADEIATLQASAPASPLIPKLTNDMDQDIDSSLAAAVNAKGTVAVSVSVGSSGTGSPSASAAGSAAGYGVGSERAGRVHILGNGGEGIAATTAVPSTISAATTSSAISSATINVYCSAFDNSTSSILIGHLEGALSLHPGVFTQFNKQCGDDSANGQDWRTRYPGGGIGASATTTTTIIATTTIMIPGRYEGKDADDNTGVVASATVKAGVRITPIGL